VGRKWVWGLFSSVSKDSVLSVDFTHPPRASCSTFPRDNRKGVSDHSQRTKFMEIILGVLDLFWMSPRSAQPCVYAER
jgi:hypothetical protein